MSGYHILEQHCHNLDVANWVMKGVMPVRAVGQGGRQVRRAKENGTIFDHHTVEFEYENGFRLLSQCCQIGGKCARDVSEHFHSVKGSADLANGGKFLVNGQPPGGKRTRIKEDAYQLEHDALFENSRTGKVRNDADSAAHSTLMGVMGRMASYTGQVITWEQALNSQDILAPDNITWNTEPPRKARRRRLVSRRHSGNDDAAAKLRGLGFSPRRLPSAIKPAARPWSSSAPSAIQTAPDLHTKPHQCYKHDTVSKPRANPQR